MSETIRTECPHCHHHGTLPFDVEPGRKIRCAACRQIFEFEPQPGSSGAALGAVGSVTPVESGVTAIKKAREQNAIIAQKESVLQLEPAQCRSTAGVGLKGTATRPQGGTTRSLLKGLLPLVVMAILSSAATLAMVSLTNRQEVGSHTSASLKAPSGGSGAAEEIAGLRQRLLDQQRLLESQRLRVREDSEEDAKLKSLAERTVADLYSHLIHPMWLRETYKVHKKPSGWIVEGIVLENPSPGQAGFWAVEIVPLNPGVASDLPQEYRVQTVVFDLHVHEANASGELVDKGEYKTNRPNGYPKLSFD